MTGQRKGRKGKSGPVHAGFGGRARASAGKPAARKPAARQPRRGRAAGLAALRTGRRGLVAAALLLVVAGLAAAGWFGLAGGGARPVAESEAGGSRALTLAVPRPAGPPAVGMPRREPPPAATPAPVPAPAAPEEDAIGALIQSLDAAGMGPPRYDEIPDETALATLLPAPLPGAPRREPGEAGFPRIAIVIDDLGGSAEAVRRLLALPGPVTYAFLTVHAAAAEQAETVAAAGMDVVLHLPMEPEGGENPGPNALLTAQDTAENLRRLHWHLARLPQAIGVNNHMGSRFTADAEKMRPVLQAVADTGRFWLDSRTSGRSVGLAVSQDLRMRGIRRDLFLDHEAEEAAILRQLQRTEQVAAREGQAIAIGHPYPETLAALEAWMPRAQARGFVMVRLSELLPPAGPQQPAAAGPERVSN